MVSISPLNLGFLTVEQQANGFVGGYLVTNQWGRPLEFRLSSAVHPNRIQQVLYGKTLTTYICADLIGKTLFEKTSIPVHILFTNTANVLDLRLQLDVPLAWIASKVHRALSPYEHTVPENCNLTRVQVDDTVYCHTKLPDDAVKIRDYLPRIMGYIDLEEPFHRIHEALAEARKLGVGGRQ